MNTHQDYPAELRDWMGAENIDRIRHTQPRVGWHGEIVDQASTHLRQRRATRTTPSISVTECALITFVAFVANGLPFFALALVLAQRPQSVTPLLVVLWGIVVALLNIGTYIWPRRLTRGR